MLTQNQILATLEKNRQKIRSFGVRRLALFGSYATGNATAQSDLDFLVEFEKGRGLFDDYTELLQFLEQLFNKQVDLVKPKLVREELRSHILEGKQVEARI